MTKMVVNEFKKLGIRSLNVTLFVFIVTLLLTGNSARAESFIHGYFLYTVENESVTITAYTGNEEEVTVPNMIAGNPVNVIAKGAFSESKSVKKVLLPDTIMTVEEGAFGTTQSVVYNSNVTDEGTKESKESESAGNKEDNDGQAGGNDSGKSGQESTELSGSKEESQSGEQSSKSEQSESGEQASSEQASSEQASSEQASSESQSDGQKQTQESKPSGTGVPGAAGVQGVTDDAGNLVTVDDGGNLIAVDARGNETVIDDTGSYEVNTDQNGKTVIRDAGGNQVEVTADGKVTFDDGNQNRVTVNLGTGNRTPENGDGEFGHEEIDVDEAEENGEASKEESTEVEEPKEVTDKANSLEEESISVKNDDAAENRDNTGLDGIVLIGLAVFVLVAVIGGIFVWKGMKDINQAR